MHSKQYKKLGFDSIHDLDNFLNREDVKQMIGPEKYDHYKELWTSDYKYKVMGETGKPKVKGKLNWLALMATPMAWYGYRRMYGLVFSLCGIFALLSFAELFYGVDTSLGMVIVLLALIFMSKNMYLSHLVRCTKKIDAMPDQDSVDNFLKWRKGTSTGLAVITTTFVLGIMIYVSVIMALELMEALHEMGFYAGGNPLYPIY